jgi:hypothetical protein
MYLSVIVVVEKYHFYAVFRSRNFFYGSLDLPVDYTDPDPTYLQAIFIHKNLL